MKKIGLVVLFSLFILPSIDGGIQRKLWLNIRDSGKETQVGLVKGTISISNEDTGEFTKLIVKDSKVVKEIKFVRTEDISPHLISGYCPFHVHPKMTKE